MMKNNYKNNEEINLELKLLRLKRDISFEELKLIKHDIKEDLSINNWVKTIVSSVVKIGAINLVKKIIK